MPSVEELAELLCQIKELRKAEYAKCNADGTITIPDVITCQTKRQFPLTMSDYLTLFCCNKATSVPVEGRELVTLTSCDGTPLCEAYLPL